MSRIAPTVVSLEPEARGPLTVFPLAPAAECGVDAFVTGRDGGVSDPPYDTLNLGDHVGDGAERVRENRERVAAAAGVTLADLVIIRQVHGDTVLEARDATPSSEGDALLGDEHDRALAILVADCVPLILIDTASRRFAVVHAGWRGLAAGVIRGALARLGEPTTVRAILGPSISGAAYEIGPEVARHFVRYGAALSPARDGHHRLDLRDVATQQLLAHGVPGPEIYLTREVTDGGGQFFSDRAARPCGRFALVANGAS